MLQEVRVEALGVTTAAVGEGATDLVRIRRRVNPRRAPHGAGEHAVEAAFGAGRDLGTIVYLNGGPSGIGGAIAVGGVIVTGVVMAEMYVGKAVALSLKLATGGLRFLEWEWLELSAADEDA